MRSIAEALSARGHGCMVLTPFRQNDRSEPAHEPQRLVDLAVRGIDARVTDAGTVRFVHRGVHYGGTLVESGRFFDHLWVRIRQLEPDAVLVSESEGDHTRTLLATVLDAAPGRVWFRAQTVSTLPFGPDATVVDPAMAALLGGTRIITNSDFLTRYITDHGGLDARTCRLPVYGAGPFPDHRRQGRGLVTIVNPCRAKGIAVFGGVADACPDVAFGAVPGWGTTGDDRAFLAGRANVRLLDPADGIDPILSQSSAVLVPSIWPEAFGLVAVEAMLRGVPVLASDVGGLPEAKLGVDYVLPVRQLEIERLAPLADGRSPSRVHEPPTELEPWIDALRELLGDPSRYQELASRSRDAATTFVGKLSWSDLERQLDESTRPSPPRRS